MPAWELRPEPTHSYRRPVPSTVAYLGLGDDDDKQIFSKHLLDSDTHGKSLLKPINLFLEQLSIKTNRGIS